MAILTLGDAHYLEALKLRLEALYELTDAPNVREQISDEVDWVESKIEELKGA